MWARVRILAYATMLAGACAPARADITVGAILSLTGPASALGIPEQHHRADAAGNRRAAYEAKFGPGTRSQPGASMWGAHLLLAAAAPRALQAGQPGTAAFRRALRDEIEATSGIVGAQAIFTMSQTDHSGSDARAGARRGPQPCLGTGEVAFAFRTARFWL